MPKVSCIMPVYNTAKYLEECIDSILTQTFTDFEFIISDDGSTDGSKEIIAKYSQLDNRVIFLDNPKNRGIVANLNDCLSIATGEYIAIMESDDISMPERFEIETSYLNNNHYIDLVGTWGDVIDEYGNFLYVWKTSSDNDSILNECMVRTQFITPGIMFRKEIFGKTGYFENNLIWDNNFYLNLLFLGLHGVNINSSLIKKRELKNGTLMKNYLVVLKETLKLRKEIIRKFKLNSFFYIKVYKNYIFWLLYFYIIKTLKFCGLYEIFLSIYLKIKNK